MNDADLPATYDVPGNIIWNSDVPVVEIRRIAARDLSQPFWEDIAARGRVVGFAAIDDAAEPDAAVLAGGIFHVYRCGSTLLCRQFSAIPSTYAIAEPPFASQLVLREGQDVALLRRRLFRVVALLAEGLGVARVVIKWPGLLGVRARVVQAALSDVPMLFLHRDPIEVLASIAREPLGNLATTPEHLLPVAAWDQAAPGDSHLTQAAALIALCCQEIAVTPGVLACDYAELDQVMLARIAGYFGYQVDDGLLAAMAAAGAWDAKAAPGARAFATDSAAKRAGASPLVQALARDALGPALSVAIAARPPLSPR